jgi:hypothetical protein
VVETAVAAAVAAEARVAVAVDRAVAAEDAVAVEVVADSMRET